MQRIPFGQSGDTGPDGRVVEEEEEEEGEKVCEVVSSLSVNNDIEMMYLVD